jgi:hypothetical protein
MKPVVSIACAFALAAGCAGTIGGGGSGGDDDDGDGAGGGGGGGGGDGAGEVVQLTGEATTAPCFGSPAGEEVDKVVDGDPQTKFLGFRSSLWLRVDAGQPAVLDHYALTSANDVPERDPASWILSGSNDGQSWTDLDVQIGESFASRFERREYQVETDQFYRWYQLRAENTSGGATQLAELELYGASPLAAADAAPAAPGNLTAAATSRSEIDLAWQPSGDDASLYRIEQSTDGSSFTAVAYAPAGASGATIAGLPADSDLDFRVVAANAAGESPPSAAAPARTLAPLVGTRNSDGSVRYSEGGYTFTVLDKDPASTPDSMIPRMVDEYFATYPVMASAFNPGAAKSVRVTFDPAYDGVAYAAGPEIVVSSAYAKGAPDDIDVVAHEGFHVVQAYANPDAPGWAVEGLADLARARYGNRNADACWSTQRYEDGQNYTDAYGVTARFLLWVEAKRPGFAAELDSALRDKTYSPAFWTAKTGKTVDALWADYAADPAREPIGYR